MENPFFLCQDHFRLGLRIAVCKFPSNTESEGVGTISKAYEYSTETNKENVVKCCLANKIECQKFTMWFSPGDKILSLLIENFVCSSKPAES